MKGKRIFRMLETGICTFLEVESFLALEDKNEQALNGLMTALLKKKKYFIKVKEFLKANEMGPHLEINEIKHTRAGRGSERVCDENIRKTEQATA